jgi:hypothetical protein
MSTIEELKAEFRVARIQVLALVERMNVILVEAGRGNRLTLKSESVPTILEDDDEPDLDDADPDAPGSPIGREAAEDEDEPSSADHCENS